ncbi:hypothetical protein SD77_4473 [Bacillus badius]|uniref:Uncharacterized protein n=1 Tax=Bacillus badius TaxID=1455 RepID=A0ABR5AVM8_BACBA|nr:hypothetical protein SD77_4473 [Bacillus badius]
MSPALLPKSRPSFFSMEAAAEKSGPQEYALLGPLFLLSSSFAALAYFP